MLSDGINTRCLLKCNIQLHMAFQNSTDGYSNFAEVSLLQIPNLNMKKRKEITCCSENVTIRCNSILPFNFVYN